MKDTLARIFFLLSVVVLSTTYGVFASLRGWFPSPQIKDARATMNNLRENVLNDLGIIPTRHLVAAKDPDRPEYRVAQPALLTPGQVLIAGLTPGRETLQGAVLYDADGSEVHFWPLDYPALVPDDEPEFNVMQHGLWVLPDGSVMVVFDNGDVLARVDACGQPVWTQRGNFHHVVSLAADGTLWSWRSEDLVQLDLETGEILDEIRLREDIIDAQDLYGALAIRTDENAEKLQYVGDPLHTNDVEPLSPEMAAAFPDFQVGDLLFSLRELNLVGVLDPQTRRLRWWSYGPWFKQHDPDFLADGGISVYDNRMGLGSSRIVRMNPTTRAWTVTFEGSDQVPFSSWRRGNHQVRPNGNLLITESEQGRVFEVSAAGELIWERNMIYDPEHNYVVTEAIHLDPDFFLPGALECQT
jgi:hypothetical protein